MTMKVKRTSTTTDNSGDFNLLTVTNTASRGVRCPGIFFLTERLADAGFISGALVQALPEPDGMAFNLCDDNIRRYSELDADTKEKGGKLIQVHHTKVRQREGPSLAVSGQILSRAGLAFGDTLIVRYGYGIVRLKKLPGTIKVIHVKSKTDSRTGKPILQLGLCGEWLSGLGFTPDALFTAYSEKGCVNFKLCDEGIERYSELVRFARQTGMKLLQVRTAPMRGKRFPRIEISGSCLDDAGVCIGEPLLTFCEFGLITLRKASFTDIGY